MHFKEQIHSTTHFYACVFAFNIGLCLHHLHYEMLNHVIQGLQFIL